MATLIKYLQQLRSLPEEVPIEPELKPERLKQDKRIRCVAVWCKWLHPYDRGSLGPGGRSGQRSGGDMPALAQRCNAATAP